MYVHPSMSPRRLGRWLATLLAPAATAGLLLLSGCSNPAAPPVPGPLTPPQHFTLQLSIAQMSLAAGTTAHVTVTVIRAPGFTGSVSLSLDGAPSGLTATITPVAGKPDTSDVAISAQANLAPLTYHVSIDGAAGIETERASFLATVTEAATFDVHGRVVDLFREPVAGALVTIAGTTATAAADGSFSLPDVARPYDAVVTLPGIDEVHEFVGLERANPVLPLLDQQATAPDGASVAGTLTNAAANTTSQLAEVVYASPEARGGAVLWPGDGPSFGPFQVTWSGPASTQGTLLALKWSVGPTGQPSQYLGFASAPLTLNDQQTATGADLQFSAVGTSYLSGTVTPPAGYAVTGKDLWLTAGPHTGMLLGVLADADPQFTFATPEAGLPIGMQARAALGNASTVLYRANLQPNQVVDMTLPAPPAAGGAGYRHVRPHHRVRLDGGAGNDQRAVADLDGGDERVRLHGSLRCDASPASVLTLPASTHYLWTVVGWGMYADMDAFTDPAGGPGSFGLGQDALVATAEPLGVFTSAAP